MARDNNWLRGDWMMTSSGRKFWPEDPLPDDLCISDIAHGLSNQIRFGGQIGERYTVAQHSVHVLELVTAEERRAGRVQIVEWPRVKLAALLHDAAEDSPTISGWRPKS